MNEGRKPVNILYLTLTRVVFEYIFHGCIGDHTRNLTLTRVVFEFEQVRKQHE